MLTVQNQRSTLRSVNPRSEKHGDSEHVPAVDISFKFDAENDLLTAFGPRLLDALYYQSGRGQAKIEGTQVSKPDLKNECLDGPLKIRYAGAGYRFHCDLGTTGDMNIDIPDCILTKVRVLPLQGGTVTFSMQVQVTHPDPAVVGRLGTMVGEEIYITLTPPGT